MDPCIRTTDDSIPSNSQTMQSPNSNSARLTIAIPFLGRIDFLQLAIESVLAQNCSSWQLVVCEDGRGDELTPQLLESFEDTRITHLRTSAVLDIAGVFNLCLGASDSEFVTLLHHDDWLYPNYVRNILLAADRHSNAAAFFCRANIVDSEGHDLWSLRDLGKSILSPRFTNGELVLQGSNAALSLVRANYIVGPSMCFRRSRLANRCFESKWKQTLDFELNMRMLMEGEVLVGLSERSYAYRRHRHQTSAENCINLTFFMEQVALLDEISKRADLLDWKLVSKAARAKRIVLVDLACQAIGDAIRMNLGKAYSKLRLFGNIVNESWFGFRPK